MSIVKRTVSIFISILIVGQVSSSQLREITKSSLTGNLRNDLISSFSAQIDSINSPLSEDDRKSPFSAALYSAVLPGSGQLYTENYLTSIGFVSAEIGLWVIYAVNNSRADKRTTEFQDFADIHWSVINYAKWMEQHYASDVVSGVYDPNYDPSRPWDYVDWNKLNQFEDNIARRPTTTGFTHRLPRRPDQQYFELIGKYPQYGGGWDDAGTFTTSDVLQRNLSARFLFYSQMRGEANDFYRIASTASYFLIANHVLSALEAAWGAARFNSRLKAEAHLVPREWTAGHVEFVPTVRINIEF